MNVFVVKTVVPNIALTSIFSGVMPFVVADFVALVLILAFPVIAVGILGLR
jgi:TRAP-type mannitol/chloroaromatic compound transport system permease large subunit